MTPGSTFWQRTGAWIGRRREGFIDPTIVEYAPIAGLAAASIAISFFASPAVGALLFYGGLALLIIPTAANIAASTYWNVTVEGQGFWEALWGGITSDSLIGSAFSTVTNYDLTTGNYLGLTWQERLERGAEALAALAAQRVGARFGQVATGQRCGFFTKCFVAGTPILVEGGSKPIEALRDFRAHGDGCDRVLSRSKYDPEGPLELRRVLKRFVRVSPVLNVLVGGRIIGTTSEHPFWVGGKGWRQAVELRAGELLQMHDGNWVAVDGVEDTGRVETVYNVEVEGFHTYFVGSNEWGFGVWAHNADAKWYHGTDSESARSIQNGLDHTRIKSTPDSDVRGLFVSPKLQTAIDYANMRTLIRNNEIKSKIASGQLPADTPLLKPVILKAKDSQIGGLLQDVPHGHGGERMIPVDAFNQVPQGAFIPLIPKPKG